MIYGKIAILSILCFLVLIQAFAQDTKKDSLLHAAKNVISPDEKARIYLELSILTFPENIKTSLEYVRQASRLAEDDELLGSIWDHNGRLHFIGNELDSALRSFQRAKTYREKVGSPGEAARVNNRIGAVLLKQKKHQNALEVFLESVSFFEGKNDSVNMAICYNNMAGVFADMADYSKAVDFNERALLIFRNNNLTQYEIITLPSLAGQYLKLEDTVRAIEYNLKAEELGLKLNNHYALGITYNNLGQLYFVMGEPLKAIEYYEKSLIAKLKTGQSANLVPTYNNLGQSYISLNNPVKATTYLKKAMRMGRGEELWPIYSNLAKAYILLGEKDSALSFFELAGIQKDSVYSIEKQQALDELLTKYETEKRENEIIRLESEKRKTNFMLSGVTGLLIATLCIAFLFVKNNRKKRVIAEQNEKLEKHRVEQLLKDQELIGIDAMMKGQEEERKKISEELHDGLGSLLSTIKLYVGSLASNGNQEEAKKMQTKAMLLLDNTYDEVRKIAHEKSGGVLINKGLLPAVKSTASKISETKTIKIEVIDAGIYDKLDSTIEIALFRTIQELLTNIVKHSNAADAVIQFSQHGKVLNIIVEDDGEGFEPNRTHNGIGLTSIRHRIEKLSGNLTIDSSPGNGATIVINVPIS